MAKIVHSETAPDEAVRYSFGAGSFELSGKSASFETNDPALVAEANAHPWLKVEAEASDVVSGDFRNSLDPADDPLSAVNDRSNDPKAVAESEAAKPGADAKGTRTAVEASLDQKKKVETAGVAETVKSDETPQPSKREKKD